jgi:hypothetical protein
MCPVFLVFFVFLQLVGVVVKTFGEAYPDLVKHQQTKPQWHCHYC